MRRLLDEPDLEVAESAHVSPIRKQVTALVPADLERFPIWEFALDEEREEGQDEATVRAAAGSWTRRPRRGNVRRQSRVRRRGRHTLRRLRVTARGAALRLHPADDRHRRGPGEFLARPLSPGPGVVDSAYRTLAKSASELFPVRYRALVDHGGAALAGRLPAFLHYRSGEDRTVVGST
jgi:hypothetical protein